MAENGHGHRLDQCLVPDHHRRRQKLDVAGLIHSYGYLAVAAGTRADRPDAQPPCRHRVRDMIINIVKHILE